jgi:hypothetical protein
MRAANIVAAISALAWLAFGLTGMDLVSGVAERVGGANVEQVRFYVVWPLLVALAVVTIAWVCNVFQRFSWALGIISTAALVVLLPYCAVSGGGV